MDALVLKEKREIPNPMFLHEVASSQQENKKLNKEPSLRFST
jgi:hypothetical protein